MSMLRELQQLSGKRLDLPVARGLLALTIDRSGDIHGDLDQNSYLTVETFEDAETNHRLSKWVTIGVSPDGQKLNYASSDMVEDACVNHPLIRLTPYRLDDQFATPRNLIEEAAWLIGFHFTRCGLSELPDRFGGLRSRLQLCPDKWVDLATDSHHRLVSLSYCYGEEEGGIDEEGGNR